MFRSVLVSISVAVLAGCGTPSVTCPAVMYGASLTVRMADGWEDAEPRSVTLRCPDGECGWILPDDLTVLPMPEEVFVPPPGSAPTPEPMPEPSREAGTTQDLDDGAATYSMDGPREELIVTVSGADGVLTERTVTPDWVRVGGSAECGGPTEAEVVVPAP